MAREKLSGEKVAEALSGLTGWEIDGDSITKQFTFENHIAAVGFVMKVAITAETIDHHPEVNWVYNRVRLTLSTHDAGGLTAKDFELAAKVDALK